MDPASLVKVAEDAKKIFDFVYGNDLKEAVSTIVGDIHVDAAMLALETAKIAVNPRDRINSVITHLEAAHVAYARNHDVQSFGSFFRQGLDYAQIEKARQRDVWVCCVMALCYASLGERQAVASSLTLAEKAFGIEGEATLIRGVGYLFQGLVLLPISMCNPRNWDQNVFLMSKKEFKEFKASLERTMA
jgi:hypothetical protein